MSQTPTEPTTTSAARGGEDSRPSSSSSRPSSSSYKLPPMLARPPASEASAIYRPLQRSRDETHLSQRGMVGTPPPAIVSPGQRPALPPLGGLQADRQSRPFSLPGLSLPKSSQPPILPPLIASAPAIPTKGSLQISFEPPMLSTSSSWSGFSSHHRPTIASRSGAERYDADQTDRFGLFRAPPPPLSYASSSRDESTRYSSDVSSSYTRDSAAYGDQRRPSESSSNSPMDYPRRLPSPRSSQRYTTYHDTTDRNRSPDRSYKRLKPSPTMPTAAVVSSPISYLPASKSSHAGVFVPPDVPPTLDETFAMLKGTKFTGKFAAVGLQGPSNLPEQLAKARAEAEVARSPAVVSGKTSGKPEIWADDAEYAFLAAEIHLPTSVNSKVQFFGKPCGRNEIIGLIITMAIGKLMTRKQVSSHLQVVRQRKNVNECVKWMVERYGRDQKEPSQGTTINQLGGLHPYLYEIMGVDPSVDLTETPKPVWISALEEVHPGAEYGGSLRSNLPLSNDSSRRDSSDSPPRPPRSHSSAQGSTSGPSYYLPQQRQSVSSSDEERRERYRGRPSSDTHPSRVKASSTDSENDDHARKRTRRSNTPRVESIPQYATRGPQPLTSTLPSQQPGNAPYIELDTLEMLLETRSQGALLLARVPFSTGSRRTRPFSSIPLANVRYRGIHALVEKYRCKVVHVEATIDVDQVFRHAGGNILINLGLYAKGKSAAGVNDVFVASTSGFLVGAFGTIGIVHISDVLANEEKDTFRSAIAFTEQKLPRLVQEQEQPELTVLPQYWIMQEVFTTGFQKSVLVGSRLSEGHCISPAAVAAQEIGLVVIYTLHAGKAPLAGTAVVENVIFDQ